MSLKALRDHILLEPIYRVPKETENGILMPDSIKEGPPVKGKVYSVGDNVNDGDRPLHHPIKPGDLIIFKEDSPRGFKYEDKVLFKIHKSQVWGLFEEEK